MRCSSRRPASCSTRRRTGCTPSRRCWSRRSAAEGAIVRVLVALGGNALLKRGEPMTVEVQRTNIRTAARSLAPVAEQPPAGALARQRTAGRPPGAAGRGLQGGRGLSARRPRRPDRGDDRVPHRAGARQPPAPRGPVRHRPHHDRGGRRRPGVRRSRPSSSVRSTRTPRPRRWRRRRAGRSSGTARSCDGWCPRPRRSGSSRSGPSAGCSSAVCWSSAPAAAGSRRRGWTGRSARSAASRR